MVAEKEKGTLFQKVRFPKRQILCISGSPRKGGNSDTMMETFANPILEIIPVESIHLRDYLFNSCIGCEKCRKDKICTGQKDGMQLIYPKVIDSQALVVISPTHNFNITAWMKAFIDRLYCFFEFENHVPRSWSSRLSGQNRKAVIMAVCEQKDKKDMGFTLEAMRMPLEALGYEIVDEIAVFRIFKKAGVREHENIKKRIEDSAHTLYDAMI